MFKNSSNIELVNSENGETNIPNEGGQGLDRDLAKILSDLRSRGILLRPSEIRVRLSSASNADKAIAEANLGFQEALRLYGSHSTWPQAAMILEKIQIAAAEAERYSHLGSFRAEALEASHIAQHLADMARDYFHHLKESK